MSKEFKIGLVLSLLGIALTFYFRWLDSYEPSITLFVDPVRTTILDQYSSQDELLHIEYDNKQISGSLHSLYIYLYNNGSKAVQKERIREPIRIHLGDGVKIITSKVIRRTHSKTGIEVTEINHNSFQVEFEELYKNDGATFQVIYEGEKDFPVNTSQEIAGIERISDFPLSDPAFYMYVTIFFLISFSLWWTYQMWLAKIRNAEDASRYKEYLDKRKGEIDSDRNNQMNERSPRKEERFVRIMNIVAPMIFIGIILGFFFISIIGVRSLIFNNPKWFVPKEIVIEK